MRSFFHSCLFECDSYESVRSGHGNLRAEKHYKLDTQCKSIIPSNKTMQIFVQEPGWAPVPVWTGGEISLPLGFDPRTAQPVVSRYTD
jgi:hypothetical protein